MQHAEMWEETGKIFIKDVKSSNGTFINGERLSLEGMESNLWESPDCPPLRAAPTPATPSAGLTTARRSTLTAGPAILFDHQQLLIHLRRYQQQRSTTAYPVGHAAIAGMGGMGGGMRAPGKSGLTFEHILNRLQGELQKSRETGTELQSLNGTMSKVHDTLGGSLPSKLPPYPHISPPSVPFKPWTHPNPNPTPTLRSHQRLFQTYKPSSTRLRHPVVTVVPHELATVAEEDEEQEKEAEAGQNRQGETSQPREEKVRDVEEEAEDAERRQRQEELGRPRTPEPASLGMGSDLFTDAKHTPQYAPSAELLDALNSRLLLLWNQFESFMTLTTSLHAQHDAAQSTILNLRAKVVELEDKVKTSQSGHDDILSVSISAASAVTIQHLAFTQLPHSPPKLARGTPATQIPSPAVSLPRSPQPPTLPVARSCRHDPNKSREEWSEGQARLAKASEEWEAKIKQVDSKLATLNAVSDPPLANGADDHPNGTLRHDQHGTGRATDHDRSRLQAMTDSTSVTSVSQANCDDDGLRAASPDFESDETLHDAKDAGELLGSSLVYDGFDRLLTVDAADNAVTASHTARKRAAPIQYIQTHPIPSTAVSVLLIGVAAAVLWKVKE
ncbi:hypothetical protein EYR36_001848 [Pleurotus pulmonarius]|nr:hypothetical protein EYR36_001848 [Pleurotus pulmonarius]